MSCVPRFLPFLLLLSLLPVACSSPGSQAAPSDPHAGDPKTAEPAVTSPDAKPAPPLPPSAVEKLRSYERYKTMPDLTGATYVGSKSCARCGHEKIYQDWTGSLHQMIRKYGTRKVLGNFNNQTLEHNGWHFTMYRKDGNCYIREVKPDGQETVYKVDYTLGNKRIQHYLSLRPDGRIRVTFPTWDILQGKWIHESEIVRSAHNITGDLIALPIQIWNQHCYNCHVSQEDQGFDIKTNTYHTTFTETGINCEMCHGPGSLHIERMEKDPKDQRMATVNSARLAPGKVMTDCMRCHDRRLMIQKKFPMYKNYYDYYMPKVLDLNAKPDPAHPRWVDSHWRFANECLNLRESDCFVKGNATCISCHDPHQVTISKDERYSNTDVLCLQCHEEYRDKEVVAAHTHHSVDGEGSRCVNCHMLLIGPQNIKLLQNASLRDHNISIPIPENTLRHNIPNTCNNTCHADKDVHWVIEWMDRWYSERPKVDRAADAIAAARNHSPDAVRLLAERVDDKQEKAIFRAAATSLLGEQRGEQAAEALIRALGDPDVLVQAEAGRGLSEVQTEKAIQPLERKLGDPNRIVRLNAVFALIKMGILEVQGAHEKEFQKARQEYFEFLTTFPEIYTTRVDLGTFHALYYEYEKAFQEYLNATKLRPDLPLAYYYLGITAAQLGRFSEAVANFKKTLELAPGFRNTSELITQVKKMMQK